MVNHALIKAYRSAQETVFSLRKIIMKSATWKELADLGFKIEAIQKYREEYPGMNLSTAKQYVDKYLDYTYGEVI